MDLYFWGSVVGSYSGKLLSKLQLSKLSPSWFIVAKRKQAFAYTDNYFKLGFTSVEINGEIRSQYVLCL